MTRSTTASADFLRGAAMLGVASGVLAAAATPREAMAQMLETGIRDDSSLSKIRKEGVMRVGYSQTGPWFYKDAKTGDLGGIYKDAVDRLAKEMEVKVECKEVTFQNSTVGLRSGDYDLYGSSLTYTMARALVVDYVGPLWSKGSLLMVHKDNAGEVQEARRFQRPEGHVLGGRGRQRGAAHPDPVSQGQADHDRGTGGAGCRTGARKEGRRVDERRQRRAAVRQAQQLGVRVRSRQSDRQAAQHVGGALRRFRVEALPRLLGDVPHRQRRNGAVVQAPHGKARRRADAGSAMPECASGAWHDRRLPRARVPALAGRVRTSVERGASQVPAEGRDAAGSAHLSRARRTESQADDAVSTRRQHLGRADRRRVSRRPLRPARVHARRRGLLRAVPAGRHAGTGLSAGTDAGADERRRRRSLHPAGGRRLRRDERLQRVRAAAASRTSSPGLLHVDEATRRPRATLAEVDRAVGSLGLRGLYYAQDMSRHGYERNVDHADFRPFWDKIVARGCRCSSSCRRRRPTIAPAICGTWPRSTRC